MKPAACYLRTSTTAQDTANQRADVEALCRARGWEPAWYVEQESALGARPVLRQLMADARGRKVGAVVVWALDRLDRSMAACVARVLELDRLGLPLASCREPWLDAGGPVRELLVAIFSWVAEQERRRMLERQAAARARVEARGGRWGRPARCSEAEAAQVLAMRQAGRSVRQVAVALKIPRSTVDRLSRKGTPEKAPAGPV